MADIDTMLAEVKRATAPVDVERVRDSGHYCCFCDGFCQNVYAGEDEQIVCDDCARIISLTAAPLLAAAYEELRAELDQTDRVNAEIGADRDMMRAEVERLRAEADRLTRESDRLSGYVRAARQLSRDARKHLLEERPEEAARVLYQIMHTLACAVEE